MMPKPKIVFAINYFYPDYASTGQLLTELCLHIQNDFEVVVIAAASEQHAIEAAKADQRFVTDRLEQIRVIRIKLPQVDKRNKWSRLRYIAAYFFFANWALLRERKVDIIYTISSPPVLGGLIGTIGKLLKRSKHIYNIQDFNPEQAEAVSFMKGKRVYDIARWLDTCNCRLADHVVTVGHDMQQTLLKRLDGKKIPANTVINNWTDEQVIIPLAKDHPRITDFKERHGFNNKFVVMYSGNLGLYYDLENLIRITDTFRDYSNLMFVFIGDGAVKRQMEEHVTQRGLSNVLFLPFQPKEDLVYSLNAADIHLVVNQKGIKGVSVPSKIYGIMAAGKTVLGVLEEGSEAHRLIQESGCGLVTEPRQYEQVITHIKALYNMNRRQLEEYGRKGRMYLEKHLRREHSLEKYRQLLLSMDTPKAKAHISPVNFRKEG